MSRRPYPRRDGISRSEFIVLGVALLLLLLLLPLYVQRGRETARRTTCEAHLRRWAIGIGAHREQKGRYPAINLAPRPPDGLSNLGRVAPGWTDATTSQLADWQTDGYSWIVQTLPYADLNLLYDKISKQSEQFRRSPFDGALVDGPTSGPGLPHLATVPLASLNCPAFGGSRTARLPGNYGLAADQHVAGGNYVAIAAATRGVRTPGVVDEFDAQLGGALSRPDVGVNSTAPGGTEGAQVGGQSTRLVLCETRQELCSSWISGQSAWVTGFPPDSAPPLVLDAAGQFRFAADVPAPRTALNWGCDWRSAAQDTASPYSATLAGGSRDWGPSSNHSGGAVPHAYLDGHVQWVAEQIDATIYLQLIGGPAAASSTPSASNP